MMMKRSKVAVGLALGLVVLGLLVMVSGSPRHVRQSATLPEAGDTLDLLAWNLGYAGLGAGSDFVADGGKNVLPPSPGAVSKNLDGILATLKAHPADVTILPEVARAGPLNYWHDLYAALEKQFTGTDRVFSADIFTRFFPWPLRLEHGLAIYSRKRVAAFEDVPLPLEPAQFGGLYKRAYSARVARLPIAGKGDWAIIGVHLAAFDENGDVRRKQLAAVLELAQRLYREGCSVVIGGDFNMTLVETNFPSTTEAKDLTWVHPFPQDALPAGWRIAADATTPSVRTNERPYHAGENYTAVIDGFIVSPGVYVDAVKTLDLGFTNSDHHPVSLRIHRQ